MNVTVARLLWLLDGRPLNRQDKVRPSCETPRCVQPRCHYREARPTPKPRRPARKLSAEAVDHIRTARAAGHSAAVLAADHGVSEATVYRVCANGSAAA